MNIRHLEMVESPVVEYSTAEVTFLVFPPEKHHALGVDKSLFRPIDLLAHALYDLPFRSR